MAYWEETFVIIVLKCFVIYQFIYHFSVLFCLFSFVFFFLEVLPFGSFLEHSSISIFAAGSVTSHYLLEMEILLTRRNFISNHYFNNWN